MLGYGVVVLSLLTATLGTLSVVENIYMGQRSQSIHFWGRGGAWLSFSRDAVRAPGISLYLKSRTSSTAVAHVKETCPQGQVSYMAAKAEGSRAGV